MKISKWMMIIFLGLFFLIGLALNLASFSKSLDIPGQQALSVLFDIDLERDISYRYFTKWFTGVTGAIMLSFSVFAFGIIKNAWESGKKWVWNTLFWGSLAWYIPDTATSAIYGVWFNVIGNTVLYLIFFLPLMISREQFGNV